MSKHEHILDAIRENLIMSGETSREAFLNALAEAADYLNSLHQDMEVGEQQQEEQAEEYVPAF